MVEILLVVMGVVGGATAWVMSVRIYTYERQMQRKIVGVGVKPDQLLTLTALLLGVLGVLSFGVAVWAAILINHAVLGPLGY